MVEFNQIFFSASVINYMVAQLCLKREKNKITDQIVQKHYMICHYCNNLISIAEKTKRNDLGTQVLNVIKLYFGLF